MPIKSPIPPKPLSAADEKEVRTYLDSAPFPSYARPKDRTFLTQFLQLWEAEDNNESVGVMFQIMGRFDEEMERLIGVDWVAWITAVPLRLQDVVLLEYTIELMRQLGKEES